MYVYYTYTARYIDLYFRWYSRSKSASTWCFSTPCHVKAQNHAHVAPPVLVLSQVRQVIAAMVHVFADFVQQPEI